MYMRLVLLLLISCTLSAGILTHTTPSEEVSCSQASSDIEETEQYECPVCLYPFDTNDEALVQLKCCQQYLCDDCKGKTTAAQESDKCPLCRRSMDGHDKVQDVPAATRQSSGALIAPGLVHSRFWYRYGLRCYLLPGLPYYDCGF